MIGFLFFTFAAVQSFWLHRLWVASDNHAARIATLEQSKPKAVVQAPQPKPKQIWDKEIEGFNPKAPKIVLPRTDEQKNQRVYTDWEIESDFNIVG